MKNSTYLKLASLFLFFIFLHVGRVSAQSLTVTVTPATACTAPCDGKAAVNDLTSFGATYLWDDPQAQTTPTATGLCPGTYSVTVTTPLGAVGATGTVTCGPGGGVFDIVPATNLSVFPNPASGYVSLDLSSTEHGNYTLSIVNMFGETIREEKISINGSLNKQIDVSIVPTGIYFIQLRNGHNFYAGKLLKQ